jgi:hypothetical protein
MNDLDDSLQRLAAEATKDVTPPEVAVIMRHGRHRQALSRPVLVGTVALVVVLAAAVALAAVPGQDRAPVGPAATTVPTPSTVSTKGWKTYTDTTGNLRFRYPPDWRIVAYPVRGRNGEQYLMLVPPRIAVPAMPPAAFQVSWRPADRSGSARTGWGEPPAWAGCPTAGPIYAPPTTLPPMTGTTSRAGRSTGARA